MRVSKSNQSVTVCGEDGERITLRANPSQWASCSEGIELSLECSGHYFCTFLDPNEVTQLGEFLKFSYGNTEHQSIAFSSEDGVRIIFRHSNMGEPYREGVDICVEGVDNFPDYMGPFVESSEAVEMRKFIDTIKEP
jgi:hypothetical protein